MRKALDPLREAGLEDGLEPGLEFGLDDPLATEGRLLFLPMLAMLSPPPPPPPMTRPLMSYCLPTWLIELRESDRGRPLFRSARRSEETKLDK